MLRVKEICDQKGISIKELADRLSVTPSAISQSLSGNPSLKKIEEIADALDVDISELFAPKDSDSFLAIISHEGELRRFDSVGELKQYLEEISEEETKKG